MSKRLLVVDDDGDMGELLQEALRARGWDVTWMARAEEAFDALQSDEYDAVVTDLNLEGMSGIELCRRVIEKRPDIPIIIITGFGCMDAAISALRARACDFMNKPIDMGVLAHSLERAMHHRELKEELKRLRRETARPRIAGELIGQSSVMVKLHELIRRVSDTDTSVLLTGESGTGKELVAKALHLEGQRADKPFVAINCAAVPENLLESELFGHTRGAFTDAKTARKGLFEEANGGTLLLDEVGEMPLAMQAKLLRVLQERRVRPVGSSTETPFDVRIIAATNRDLDQEVEEGRFRQDLYYRLNVVHIHVPPLRSRGNDVLLLAQHFVRRFGERMGKPVTGVSPEAAKKLLTYDWVGNVRQLENWMERAVALARFEQITVDDLPEKLTTAETQPKAALAEFDSDHVLNLEEVERRYIERVLRFAGGNKLQAAKLLGLDRRTLYRKLERYESQSSP
ncbi:MAG TPA: sigma-54 dependent transcriptional regulator [Polyangiaceae bacterium]|nr:sigma-54 dependent transcriptional regulator [Polyangiaceae bacterium]